VGDYFVGCQDGAGGRTITWPSSFKNVPPFDPTPSACSLIGPIAYDGAANYYEPGSTAVGLLAMGATAANCSGTVPSGQLCVWLDSVSGTVVAKDNAGNRYIMTKTAGATNGLASTDLSDSNALARTTNPALNTFSSLGTSTGSGLYIPGTSLTAGSAYYQASGALTLAKANVSTTVPAVCIAISATQCMTFGTYRFSTSQSWTAGQVLYVSDASAGAIMNSSPSTSGHYVQRIGVALAADTIQFMPSIDVGGIQ
jgi:hypothetical protein